MATIRNRADLPDHDKGIADIIEQFGFKWVYDTDYDRSRIRDHMQVRKEKHYTPPAMVTKLRDGLRRNDPVPAITTAKDDVLINGNTTNKAADLNKMPTLHAFILDRPWNGEPGPAQQAVQFRMKMLGIRLNQHGERATKDEERDAIEFVGPDSGYDAKRVAELVGCTEGFVQMVWAQMKACTRLARLGLEANGNLTGSQMRVLGSAPINDRPFEAIYHLTEDAGLSPTEQRQIIKRAKEARDDRAALLLIEQEREARADQIAEYRARGHSKPPLAGALRMRTGYIRGFKNDPGALCEHNPTLIHRHVAEIKEAIEVLQRVLELQQMPLDLQSAGNEV